MKKAFLVLLTSVLCFSCKNREAELDVDKNDNITSEKKFDMYEMSEMASLMEQMYKDNEKLKERIIKGDTIGKFPDHFLEIHAAVMTDEQENDAFFKAQAANFINAQKLIYEDPKNAKEHFNSGVDACVQCHEVKCGGPIPRIKKLYIQ
jgi:cytochrome c553